MRRLKIPPGPPAAELIAACARAIQSGGVVAYPTDTLYGLGADPDSARGVAALFLLKGRADDQALPLIAGSPEQAARVASFTPLARRLAGRFWPGPLTLVLRATHGFAPGVAAADGSIAIRVPDQPVARALAVALGGPLTATSANRSGEPPARSADEVAAAFGDAIEVLLDAGPAPGGIASSIVDARGAAPRLVRAGAVPWERVLESLQ